MRDHLKLLGMKVKDVVTGAEGIVETVAYDLYGCVQAIVRQSVDEKGAVPDARWFDVKRLTIIGDTPVMEVPTFAPLTVTGGTEKPARPSHPAR